MDGMGYKPLPGRLFLVRVPIVATYSDEEIELLGLPVSTIIEGSGEDESIRYDKTAYKELTTVMLPLSKIIDIYCAGMRIQLVNQKDTLEVFKILKDYITGLEQGPSMLNMENMCNDPRLDNIKKFTEEMFGWNTGRIKDGLMENYRTSIFKTGLQFMGRRDRPQTVTFTPKRGFIDNTPKYGYSMPRDHTGYPFTPPDEQPRTRDIEFTPIRNFSQPVNTHSTNCEVDVVKQDSDTIRAIQQEFIQQPTTDLSFLKMPEHGHNGNRITHSELPDFNLSGRKSKNELNTTRTDNLITFEYKKKGDK